MSIITWFMRQMMETHRALSRTDLARSFLFLFLLIVTGTLTLSITEGWSPLNALYATVITVTTIGYGDLTPQSTTGRLFVSGFALLAVSLGGYAFTSLSAYVIQNREHWLAARHRSKLMQRINALKNHYILCGADWLGARIAEDFNLAGVDFLVIDTDADRLRKTLLHTHPEYFRKKIRYLTNYEPVDLDTYESLSLPEVSEKVGIPYLLGDPTDVMLLLQAGIERAAGLISTWDDDRDNLSIVIGARNIARRAGNETLRIMTRVNDPREMKKLYLAGADHVRIPAIVSGREMASHMLHPEIGNWWYSRSAHSEKNQGWLEQREIDAESTWHGLTTTEVHARYGVVTLSVKRGGEFTSPPPHDWILQVGDIAIVLTAAQR